MIRWILLLQEFNLIIKDKNGAKNVVVDHLSRLINEFSIDTTLINDSFPHEFLFSLNKMPWYAIIINYLTTGENAMRLKFPSQEKILKALWTSIIIILSRSNLQIPPTLLSLKHIIHLRPPLMIHQTPPLTLSQYCFDQNFQRRIPEDEVSRVIQFCHSEAYCSVDFIGLQFSKIHMNSAKCLKIVKW